MRSLGSVPASAACLMRLHHLLFAGHASAVDECVANLNFLRVVRDGWLRALAVDPLSAQFLADYAHLLAQKVALLSRYTALECNFALKPTGAASSLDATCARLALTLCNATILLIGPLVGAAAQLSEQQRACAASAPALVTECSNAFVLASHVLSVRPAECAALAPEYATTFARVTRLFEWASSRRLPVQLFPLPPAVPRFDGAFVVPLPLAIARR
jgi:hypothetical protein